MILRRLAATRRFLQKQADARGPMERWVEIVNRVDWRSIIDARKTFPTADLIKGTNLTVFNIGGNNYRLITVVTCKLQTVVVIELLTHGEYDRKYT